MENGLFKPIKDSEKKYRRGAVISKPAAQSLYTRSIVITFKDSQEEVKHENFFKFRIEDGFLIIEHLAEGRIYYYNTSTIEKFEQHAEKATEK